MAKSTSPAKPRGRPKSKSEPKTEQARSKSRSRTKSRGRSPTPKAPKARKASSSKRSTSRPRSRTRSKSRKSETKPRSRSSSRPSQAGSKKAVSPDSKAEVQPTRVSRRTIAKEASKAKSVVDAPTVETVPKASKIGNSVWSTLIDICNYDYKLACLGFLWFVLLPSYAMLVHIMCTRDRCYPRWPMLLPVSIKTYFDPLYIIYGLIVVLCQGLLSAIPLGSVVTGFGYRRAIYKYRSNGLLTLILSCGLFYSLAKYTHFPHTTILISNRFKCVCAMSVVALMYSMMLWCKSFLMSPIHFNLGSSCSPPAKDVYLHDAAFGREVSPKLGEVFDLGLLLLRTSNFLWAVCIYSAIVLSKSEDGVHNYNVLFIAVAQGTHVLLASYYEMNILKSAYINQGVGFVSAYTCLVIIPFCHTLPLRYVLDHKHTNETLPVYVGLFLLYCVGLFLIFHTNYAKYKNARSGGKKVIRTGCYAIVRHPNYLGELMCMVIVTALTGFNALLWVHCAYMLSVILSRMYKIEKNTNFEYKQYAEQVRSRLIPFIF